jgi:iron(III) transport system substrate-binding protein
MTAINRLRVLTLTTAAVLLAASPTMAQEADPALVEAAQKENPLRIYAAVPQSNWQGVIDAFRAKYPWFKVEVVELQSAEVYTRYEIEVSSNAASADIIASGIRPSWATISSRGLIANIDIELPDSYPDWANEFPGVYAFNINPQPIAYNKLLIPEDKWPKSTADIAALVRDNPGEYDRHITTYTPDNAYGQELIYSWVRAYKGDPWEILGTLIPATIEESSGGTMLAKLSAGEYKIAYFQSGNALARSSNASFDRVIGWTMPTDGVPIGPGSAAISSKADSPATAELFLRFLLSDEGQAALPMNGGGMNPILGTVPEGGKYFTYTSLADQVGEENVILSGSTPEEAGNVKAFLDRWKSLRR